LAKHPKKHGKPHHSARRASAEIRVRQVPGENAWELLHPRCALERREDMEEVEAMLEAGEVEIAKDELRWLLSGCPDFIDAHRLLGEIALSEGDVPLARGHFGHAFRVAVRALTKTGNPQPLPYSRAANQAFYECGKGLVHCLLKLAKKKMAAEIIDRLLQCDATDPLGVRELQERSD
jgi:hypothetical protein